VSGGDDSDFLETPSPKRRKTRSPARLAALVASISPASSLAAVTVDGEGEEEEEEEEMDGGSETRPVVMIPSLGDDDMEVTLIEDGNGREEKGGGEEPKRSLRLRTRGAPSSSSSSAATSQQQPQTAVSVHPFFQKGKPQQPAPKGGKKKDKGGQGGKSECFPHRGIE